MGYSVGSVADKLLIEIIRKQTDKQQKEDFIQIALHDGVIDRYQAEKLRLEK